MAGERLRIPTDDSYMASLGLCIYAFARLEWDAVWCCERIRPGAIRSLPDRTAGVIASELLALALTLGASPEQTSLVEAARAFKALVLVRNSLVHAKPGSMPDGTQRLVRDGAAWSAEELNEAADRFTECSAKLNGLLHGFLASYVPFQKPLFASST